MVFKPILTKSDLKKIVKELKSALRKSGIKVGQLILFGSYAKGRPHPFSDVDLCVVSGQFGKQYFDEMVKISKIGKRVNYLLEVHPMNPSDLKQNAHPLAEEIRKHGKKV